MLNLIDRFLGRQKKPSAASKKQASSRLLRLQTACVRTKVQHEMRAAREGSNRGKE